MRVTKGQRRVLVVAWVLVLASTVWPPTLAIVGNGTSLSRGFGPVWRVLIDPSGAGVPVRYEVNWSRLTLIWVWIGLGMVAGLWVCRQRWRRPARCEACGYSLAGLAGDAVCPECGAGSV